MKRNIFTVAAIVLAVVFFSACNKVPQHAKYIPENAVVVAGINTKEMGKEVAWEAFTGSKLYKKLMGKMKDKEGKSFENSGIDWVSTSYLCITPSETKEPNFAAILPVSSTDKWETFIAENFNNPEIKTVGDRKEAMLNEDMYAGWNDDVIIVTGVATSNNYPQEVYSEDNEYSMQVAGPDPEATAVGMERLFNPEKKSSLAEDERFTQLEKEGHHITLWMNYGNFMNAYQNMTAEFNMAPLQGLWKNAAMAAGIDFKKGAVTGEMRYYAPPEWKDIYKKFGERDVDADMVKRLPQGELNMLMAAYMSPEGMEKFLEKTGFGAIVNMALAQSQTNIQDVLKAFSGDMVVAIGDVAIKETSPDDSTITSTPDMNVLFALKINEEEKFASLWAKLTGSGMMQLEDNVYYAGGNNDSFFVMRNDKLVVGTNSYANGKSYLNKTNSIDLPAPAKDVLGNPMAFYIDANSMSKSLQNSSQMKKLAVLNNQVEYFTMDGGKYNDGVFKYDMRAELTNKEENSLLVLMDMASN